MFIRTQTLSELTFGEQIRAPRCQRARRHDVARRIALHKGTRPLDIAHESVDPIAAWTEFGVWSVATPSDMPAGPSAYIRMASSIFFGSSQHSLAVASSVQGAHLSRSALKPVRYFTPAHSNSPSSTGSKASSHGYLIGLGELVFASHTTKVLASPAASRSEARTRRFVSALTR